MSQYVHQQTLQYTTFIKRNIVEALANAFSGHPSSTVADAFVGIDFKHTRFKLPAVIIKLYERQLPNAGVAHIEYLPYPDDPNVTPTQFIPYYQRFYKGDVAFEIWGESSVDRDVVRDALIEVLAMQDLTTGGYSFIQRLYNDMLDTPFGLWHMPVLNLDIITGYGEQMQLAPWQPEDGLVYQSSYRVPIFGEFYSATPQQPSPTSTPPIVVPIDEVDVYPYTDADPTPDQNPDGPNAPGWWHFTGSTSNPVVPEEAEDDETIDVVETDA